MKVVLSFLLMAFAFAAVGCQSASNSNSTRPASAPAARGPQDFVVTTQVKASLSEAGIQDAEVKTVYGEVTLCGYVDDMLQKQRAEQIARSAEGVVKVNNYLIVGKRPPVNINKPGGPREKACDF